MTILKDNVSGHAVIFPYIANVECMAWIGIKKYIEINYIDNSIFTNLICC